MNAGFFGLVAYLIEDNRNKGKSMSATHANALQEDGAAHHAASRSPIKCALEQRLAELLPKRTDSEDLLTEAMHHAVLGGGKRVPSLLFMSILRDLGHDATGLLDLASAIEIVHAASLILDDLPSLGDATLRHGQPAVHIKFGEDIAMLAAVALLSHAFHIVACAEGVLPDARIHLTSVLAEAVGAQGLAKGQYDALRDIHQSPDGCTATSCAPETGSLLGVAIEMASIVAKTSREATR